ncbi:hypothetical protein NUJ30_08250 [Burkholderia contaminans]|uniref:hypothetical protein n=1 Tax=Burkholderia TaxID=32008 RepID=UPI0010F7D33F|nr:MULTISPECIES: hypothetical protein [Burkholderia]MBD1412894.1 hypothetical protein [Burkholderia contaminans]UXZ68656.1 hypothetical protein NUJ29_08255 [Burkholderia contaminans]UXZ76417.1 hypothetical protein NUJ30_08250 [Burkholderia contaminans]
MNQPTESEVQASIDRHFRARGESAALALSAKVAPTSTTETGVDLLGNFEELLGAAKAAAEHHVRIAISKRYFGDADASQSIADAERYRSLVERQSKCAAALPAILALLLDMSTEPQRRSTSFPTENRPEWAELYCARAANLIRAMTL